MIRIHRAAALTLGLLLASGAHARPPMETNQLVDDTGNPIGTAANPLYTRPPSGGATSSGALAPPTAAAGKIVDTSVALSANTSTRLVAARGTSGDRIAIEIQCDGLAAVGVDMKGGTLTSATAAPRVIPSGSYPLYTPPIATQTAITAYTGTAQTCRVTEYLR